MTINYIDTRGNVSEPIPFTQAVVRGIAPGGGLYVPERVPKLSIDEVLGMADVPYSQQAAFIYKKFEIDMPDELIDELMGETYGAQFDCEDVCPIVSLDKRTHVLELWHGPTSAFKDMALQCLPRFFSASARLLQERGGANEDRKYMILTATSGDTGKAALEGFRDVDGVSIGVLYPHGGVSDVQYLQMATQEGKNVRVWGVRGNFDDCQTSAKAVFGDAEFAEKLLREYNTVLSSANSINWGRLMPQIVYYVSAYARLVAKGAVSAGEKIDVCVPTGNFGNILAAWYAREMGVPIAHTFCASNANHVLSDFIGGAPYDIREREFVLTPSPSMDILVSSNLERQLFECSGRRSESVRKWMQDLKREKMFDIDSATRERLCNVFRGAWVDNETCLATIKRVFERYEYLLDPHTAVAYRAGVMLREEIDLDANVIDNKYRPVLIASTAHWAKFGINVYRALHNISAGADLPVGVSDLSGCALNRLISEETESSIPAGLARLEDMPVRFKDVIDPGAPSVEDAVCEFLGALG